MTTSVRQQRLTAALESAVTKAATYSKAPVDLALAGAKHLIVTLDITAAERDSSDETYDVYITASDGVSTWDIAHFPQVATTGAKRYTARILADRLAEVTTATPGVAAEPTAIMKTDTSGSNEGKRTLAAGKVRHGPIPNMIGYDIVIAGTVVTGISYSINIQAA